MVALALAQLVEESCGRHVVVVNVAGVRTGGVAPEAVESVPLRRKGE